MNGNDLNVCMICNHLLNYYFYYLGKLWGHSIFQ